MPNTLSVAESEVAGARAAAYGLLAHGFHYPDAAGIATLAEPARWEGWPEVLREIDEHLDASLQDLRKTAEALVDCSDDARRGLQERYDGLFGHAVRGLCPAYEMEYGRHEIIRQASDLADLAGFYHAFGFGFAPGANGRPDHIAAECEFMGALCGKEAYAHSQSDSESAEICLDAERTFMRDHLARWLPAFAHRVQESDGDGLFAAFVRFADDFVAAECRYFDIHSGPATLELKEPDAVLDRTISCGSGGCGDEQGNQPLVQLGNDTPSSESR